MNLSVWQVTPITSEITSIIKIRNRGVEWKVSSSGCILSFYFYSFVINTRRRFNYANISFKCLFKWCIGNAVFHFEPCHFVYMCRVYASVNMYEYLCTRLCVDMRWPVRLSTNLAQRWGMWNPLMLPTFHYTNWYDLNVIDFVFAPHCFLSIANHERKCNARH